MPSSALKIRRPPRYTRTAPRFPYPTLFRAGAGVSYGVIEALRRALPEARFLELVHRLDKETSGLLMIAKKRSALTNLQDQLRDRETGKTYAALVWGDWPEKLKVIDRKSTRLNSSH